MLSAQFDQVFVATAEAIQEALSPKEWTILPNEYLLLGKIDEGGGMGVVYLAEDLKFDPPWIGSDVAAACLFVSTIPLVVAVQADVLARFLAGLAVIR